MHLTDLCLDLIGPIESVAAFPANRMAFAKSADVLSLQLRFACGATGNINTILATPFYARLIIYGSDAWAEVQRNASGSGGPHHANVSAAHWTDKHIDTGMEKRGPHQPGTVRAVDRGSRGLSVH
jgi:hypothetical protein